MIGWFELTRNGTGGRKSRPWGTVKPMQYLPADYGNWGVGMQSVAKPRRRSAHYLAVALMVSALGGCGLPSLTSGLGPGGFGGSSQQTSQVQSVSEEQLLSAAKAEVTGGTATNASGISPGCPKFEIWPRDNNLTIYMEGRVGDGLAIRHRGEITKTARECAVEGSRVTVKYGFSGRVLLGPSGAAGPVTLPVHIFVTDAKREKVATDAMQVSVNMVMDQPIGYFSAVQSITFDVAQGARPGEYEMFVAFDRNAPGAG